MPHFESQDPASFGWRPGPHADIVPFSYNGREFAGGVARGTEWLFTSALDRICGIAGFVLPTGPSTISGNWGFSDRLKKSGSGYSFHGYGLAIDVAAPWNPYGASIPGPSDHRLPGQTGNLVRTLGLLWGGDFRGTKDWMHLEVHLSPQEVRELDPGHLPTVGAPSFPLPSGYYYGPRSGPTQSVSCLARVEPGWREGLIWAQQMLGCTPQDGKYGPITASAARQFQAARGLNPDGLIGIRTWSALAG